MADSVEESHEQRPDGEDTSSLRQTRIANPHQISKALQESHQPDNSSLDKVGNAEMPSQELE